MLPIIRLESGFTAADIEELLTRPMAEKGEAEEAVAGIVEDVRLRGDEALLEYTAKFDGYALSPETIRVAGSEIDAAYNKVSPEFISAIRLAVDRVRRYHERQKQNSWFEMEEGSLLGQLVLPIERAGIYVPGGRASYPSSVVMSAIPAKVAGVSDVAMCFPNPPGRESAEVLVAARESGVDEIYRIGGAQAIAAMAYGTKSVPKVDKIAGPGNIYVTLAKRLVIGAVDIDMLAGPSEVVVVADASATPSHIAADLLAQAEHDPDATAILITTDEGVAHDVNMELAFQTKSLDRKEIAEASLEANGRIFLVEDVQAAMRLANGVAPEHLELCVQDPYDALALVKHAGAVFLGGFTPESVGDYVAGPSHVLPTGGTARFYSPLSVDTFVKKSSVLSVSRELLRKIGPAAVEIARHEGFDAHAKSIEKRL
ncbi:MAG: histidinol dehydrogenase [Candidatus Aquicultorales bacterium]